MNNFYKRGAFVFSYLSIKIFRRYTSEPFSDEKDKSVIIPKKKPTLSELGNRVVFLYKQLRKIDDKINKQKQKNNFLVHLNYDLSKVYNFLVYFLESNQHQEKRFKFDPLKYQPYSSQIYEKDNQESKKEDSSNNFKDFHLHKL